MNIDDLKLKPYVDAKYQTIGSSYHVIIFRNPNKYYRLSIVSIVMVFTNGDYVVRFGKDLFRLVYCALLPRVAT